MRQFFGCCLLIGASWCLSGCGGNGSDRQGAIPVEHDDAELKQVMDENMSQGGGKK